MTMKPSEALKIHREDIRRVVAQWDANNPRVFGSVVHGDDTVSSDLDILVDPISGKTTLMSLVQIQRSLSELMGVAVDVQTPRALSERFREKVLAEAVPV
jgi:predicted nucleotidyltransferase